MGDEPASCVGSGENRCAQNSSLASGVFPAEGPIFGKSCAGLYSGSPLAKGTIWEG